MVKLNLEKQPLPAREPTIRKKVKEPTCTRTIVYVKKEKT